LTALTFEGTVTTGEGNGKRYLALPWVKQQVEEKAGFSPFFGTLNLKLTAAGIERRKLLNKTNAATICPAQGYCVGLLFKASIARLECAVVLPQIKNYPENMLEIIAPVKLRDKLKVKDGDALTVSVQVYAAFTVLFFSAGTL
jgi:riboflavin kinase, archaea type